MIVNCRICKKGLDVTLDDIEYYGETYWNDKTKFFTHGECWEKFSGLPVKRKSFLRTKLLERDKVCQKCGSIEKLTLDHIYPKSRGGKTIEANLQVLCSKCNSLKSNKI